MPAEELRLLACQIDVPVTRSAADRDAHLAEMAGRIDAALHQAGADLVVLPELASIDYSREAFGALDQLAEPQDGPSFQTWSSISRRHGVHVAYSFARTDGDASYITLAVTDPSGELVGHYDKIYLAQYGASMEKDYFARGTRLFSFDVNGFTIAPIICADIRIPELARALTVERGADVILHSGAYFRDESFHTWHSFVVTRAIENQTYVVSLNRAGRDYGSSMFCPPWVDDTVVPTPFPETGEHLARLTVRRDAIMQARRDYSFLADRLEGYDG